MSLWISMDGGGTKTKAVLFNEHLKCIAQAQSGGVNTNFQSLESARKNVFSCLGQLLRGVTEKPAGIIVSMPVSQIVLDEIRKACAGSEFLHFTEGKMSVLSGLCVTEGFAAVCGTGSSMWFESGQYSETLGGEGLLLGDEGSCSHMGQAGLKAVIHAVDGRGKHTVLEDEFARFYGRGLVFEELDQFVSSIYASISPRSMLASFTPFIFSAAKAGDPRAAKIVREAAEMLACQLSALRTRVISKYPEARTLECTISGGGWKNGDEFFRHFKEKVALPHPDFRIHYPLFEPVAGGAVFIGYRNGLAQEQIIGQITKEFAAYKITPPQKD